MYVTEATAIRNGVSWFAQPIALFSNGYISISLKTFDGEFNRESLTFFEINPDAIINTIVSTNPFHQYPDGEIGASLHHFIGDGHVIGASYTIDSTFNCSLIIERYDELARYVVASFWFDPLLIRLSLQC